jgi:hypothetical protein
MTKMVTSYPREKNRPTPLTTDTFSGYTRKFFFLTKRKKLNAHDKFA